MNVMSLNFLQNSPDENWLDYFINYDRFLDLLQSETTDTKLIQQLFDQFVEHALSSVSEAKNVKRKRMDPDEITSAEQKADKLWLFGWACASRLGWDLNVLMKCSDVVRVFSMVSRLFEYTFNVEGEGDILSFFSRNEDSFFNSRNTFVSWLYARLVLMIDMQARVPPPPQKPTVSNPNNQIDPALVEAEKISTFIFNVRKHTRNAVTHLERLINLGLDKIEIPTFYCFRQLDTQNEYPSTSNKATYVEVSMQTFVIRIKADLLLAHFAASHFTASRKLLGEIGANLSVLNTLDHRFANLFAFDQNKFEGYKAALSYTPNKSNKRQKISPHEFNTSRTGTSEFSTNEHLEKAKLAYNSAIDKVPDPILHLTPTYDYFLRYSNHGPPLWQILNCFDYNSLLTLYAAFCERDPQARGFMDKIVTGNISPVFAKLIEQTPIENEPVLFYLMQLEKLVDNWDISAWKLTAEHFLQRMISGKWSAYACSICLEMVRVNAIAYNNLLGHQKDKKALITLSQTKDLAKGAVERQNEQVKMALKWCEESYFVLLLNLDLCETVVAIPILLKDFQSQYSTFARLVASLYALDQPRPDIQWKYFMPLLHHESNNFGPTLPKDKLIEVLESLKNEKICRYIMGFFASLFNSCANAGMRQMYPYAEGLKNKNSNVCYVNKLMFNPNPVEVSKVFTDNLERVDLDFVAKAMEILLRNILLMCKNDAVTMCQFADLCYAYERYAEAAQIYATIIYMFEQGLWDMSDYDKIASDSMIAKLVHCFYELKFFTLAAITGQILRDIRVHLFYVLPILKQTSQINDGGKAYYPYLYSIPIFEAMSDAYDQNDMSVYYISLLKLCPTRALNQSNSADVIREEISRRRSRFIEIMYKTVKNI